MQLRIMQPSLNQALQAVSSVALAEKRLNNPSEIDRLLGIWDRKEDTVITGDKPVGLDVIQWTLL